MVKTILWVEDFANDADLVPDDYDPTSKITPDRTEQIQELFPADLVDTVQILEDPTQLPQYMKEYGKDYELILLDINFETGISQLPEDREAFAAEMVCVGMPPLSQPQTIKALGYYLYMYLIMECHVKRDNIVFFSAYCDEDTISGFREHFSLLKGANFFDKKETEKMRNDLNERFNKVLPQAKVLFKTWKANGIPKDSILRLVGDFRNWKQEDEDRIINNIENALDKADPSCDDIGYGEILGEATSPFDRGFSPDFSLDKTENRWYRGVYEILKSLRNLHAHRSAGLPAKEFLLLFAVSLRAIFESTEHSTNELQKGERWLADVLEKEASENGVVTRLDSEQVNVRIEEKLLQWYLCMCREARLIGTGYDLICSLGLKYSYTQERIVHLFCMRALNVILYCNPKIMSSFNDENDSMRGPYTRISPNITIYFQAYFNPRRDDSKLGFVPKPMQKLAEAYIRAQLEYKTERELPLLLYP